MISNYTTKKKSGYSTNNNYNSKTNNYSPNKINLYVSNNQVKEKKGICTCKKKTPCKGTCRL